MASALDRALPPVALKLIRQFGKAVTLVYPGGEGAYDPEKGEVVGGEPVRVEVRGIIESYSDFVVSGGAVQRGDRKLTVAALGLPEPPTTAVAIEIGGATHAVIDVEAVHTGEVVALYVMQVRR